MIEAAFVNIFDRFFGEDRIANDIVTFDRDGR